MWSKSQAKGLILAITILAGLSIFTGRGDAMTNLCHRAIFLSCLIGCLSFFNAISEAAEPIVSTGETVYVPVYSNVFSAPKQIPIQLATILSIRNTDMTHSIMVHVVDYYDTKGKLLKHYYQQPITLAPLESTHIYLPEDDTAGGVGANFIVKWKSGKIANEPIIECIMLGTRSGQGISFVSPGHVIKE